MALFRSELEGVPQGLALALLAQIEQQVRNARQLSTKDTAQYELACISICMQLKAILDLTSRVRSATQEPTEQ